MNDNFDGVEDWKSLLTKWKRSGMAIRSSQQSKN